MSLQETAHVAEIDRTVTGLQSGGGVVLLHGAESQQAIDLTMLALNRLPADHAIAIVDVTRCHDDLSFAHALAFAAISTYLGTIADEAFLSGQWRAQRDADLLALAELTPPGFYATLTDGDTLSDPRELFELSIDLLERRAADGPTVLVLLGAEELAVAPTRRSRFRAVHDLLWILRARLQQSIGTSYVLFAGGDRTADLITAKDGAFYGWGTEVLIDRLPVDLLCRHLEAALPEIIEPLGLSGPSEVHSLATNLASACDGSTLLAQQLLDLLPVAALKHPRADEAHDAALADRTLSLLLNLNAGRLRVQTRLVRGLAPNALRIATALANEQRPYSVVGHPSEAARALRTMVDAGIATQRADTRWSLCDPLFAQWLKQPAAGRLRVDRRAPDPIPRWALTS